MPNSKFVDPRLQAREERFQHLHLSTFETMQYARTIQEQVEESGYDIESTNVEYLQLLRDYQVTKNLAPISDSPLKAMCDKTDIVLKASKHAYANCAQLCAAAIATLNHWRILSEIPSDLRDNEAVTRALKDKLHQQMDTWNYILDDLFAASSAF